MTREEWAELSDREKRIKIAELCGWQCNHSDVGMLIPPGKNSLDDAVGFDILPDYLNDLNAMHEAEKMIKGKMIHHYLEALEEYVYPAMATAAQRAEAFALTMD